jgi:hypothetical protein
MTAMTKGSVQTLRITNPPFKLVSLTFVDTQLEVRRLTLNPAHERQLNKGATQVMRLPVCPAATAEALARTPETQNFFHD